MKKDSDDKSWRKKSKERIKNKPQNILSLDDEDTTFDSYNETEGSCASNMVITNNASKNEIKYDEQKKDELQQSIKNEENKLTQNSPTTNPKLTHENDVSFKTSPNPTRSNSETNPKLTQNSPKTNPNEENKLTQNSPTTNPKLTHENDVSFETSPNLTRSNSETNPNLTQNSPKKHKTPTILSGGQKLVFWFIFSNIKESGKVLDNGDRLSQEIVISHMKTSLNLPTDKATRRIVDELVSSVLIHRYFSKEGRGGWTIYKIDRTTFLEAQNYNLVAQLTHNSPKTNPELTHKLAQSDSRKEGSIYNNNYLTSESAQNPIEIKHSEMFDLKTINHENTRSLMPDYNYWPKYLNDLKRNLLARKLTLSTVDLQNLIDRLPEYISFSSNSGQPVKHVGGFFIKEAMNFAEGAECTLTLFKTKAEIQRQDALTRLKQKAIEEQKQMAMDIDQIKLGLFAEWRNSFTVEEQKTMTHPMNSTDILIRSAMRAKFETEVWPTKKIELGLD